ncbi:MAG: bifunctional diaminohydroxyphosphoribosylaminopyrimidine deaminase/5-amino-6-(5-phosphoribosylamino)uracil reductase RibD [Candidatus Latescibacteria bacterium]|nr:bifunctional diaminohydroxyphosphoribosylaminopyrimidine deaminase/5-amino-6-(5-phosphoribosylamino)uracil reductase RibD [bacterium]MBD3424185.1 bifunctional diaminohydroxyphosphoribosylaminopyrimidine deaminase/5-amino-6-(5-phosphoribosylamino)uracil reductase RibD [Candidatus Latescibacterota bacterium]
MPHLTDEFYMDRALQLAETALSDVFPNPRVGAVLVSGGEIVGEGVHRYCGGPHAEIEAISNAGERAEGATLYLNLEPCCHHGETPPCTEAIIAAGISRVVFGIIDPDERVRGRGAGILRESGIEVKSGVRARESFELNYPFIFRRKTGRALIAMKVAITLDGRIGVEEGGWFTSSRSREYVHYLRAYHQGVATGIGTVLADNPSLDRRFYRGGKSAPVKIVFDSRLRFPPESGWLDGEGRVIIYCSEQAQEKSAARLERSGAEVVPIPAGASGLELRSWREDITAREITSVLVEGGAGIATSMLQGEIADILYLFTAPRIAGSKAIPWYSGETEPSWIRGGGLELSGVEDCGGDILAVYHSPLVSEHYLSLERSG